MPACGSPGISVPNTRNLLYAWSVKLFRYIGDRSTPKMSERIEIIPNNALRDYQPIWRIRSWMSPL
jgi:hypothetical protein